MPTNEKPASDAFASGSNETRTESKPDPANTAVNATVGNRPLRESSTMRVHPAADLFPLLQGEDFDALVTSIKCYGQQVPCIRDGDVIIDGRNRHRACQELGIETKWIEWGDVVKQRPFEYSGEGELLPSEYIWTLNFDRRHLTDDQMAMLWDKWHPIKTEEAKERKRKAQEKGRETQAKVRESGCGTIGPTSTPQPKKQPTRTRTEVAKKLGVSERKLRAAVKLKKESPGLAAKVARGEMSMSEATRAAAKARTAPEWLPDELERKNKVMRGETVVANQSRDKSLIWWATNEASAVRIDRPGPYGNPFILGKDGDRETVCNLFRDHHLPFKASYSKEDLRGKVLICHCYPERCHGNDLALWADK